MTDRTSVEPITGGPDWHQLSAQDVAARFGTDLQDGLSTARAADLLRTYGRNELTRERAPSVWMVALAQFRDPMTLMLVAVAVVSILIAQGSTAAVVIALILLNVVLGTNQELKARASVEALSSLQVPQARVVRDGEIRQVSAEELVPGDLVAVESGDVVPADGRLVRAATLETQEAALTGESAPVAKSPTTVTGDDVPLGDRSDMLFQNTSVTRGSGTMLVTLTGGQWLLCTGLAVGFGVVVELDMAWQRRRAAVTVAPRAVAGVSRPSRVTVG